MWRERRRRGKTEGWRTNCEIQSLAPENGTASARFSLARLGPRARPCLAYSASTSSWFSLLPLRHLLFCNFLFLLSRQNAERERLVNEAHAHMLARTRSVPSSPFPCVAPWSPCLAAGLPPSALPSATTAASTARFFLRRRRRRRRHGLKHNAPRRTA